MWLQTPQRRASLWLALAVALALGGVIWVGHEALDAQWLQAHQQDLLAWRQAWPVLFALGYFVLFVLLSALAIPGCGLMSLAAGACFGFAAGTLMVVVASSAGATLSFLAARHLGRDWVRQRFGHRLGPLEAGLARDGARYLFSLRLAPVIPYALLNPLMGLTLMSTRTFFVVSLLGMLAGSAAYVHAGSEIARLGSWAGLWSPGLLTALALLAVLPWVARWVPRRVAA